jgi:hypothetical protein
VAWCVVVVPPTVSVCVALAVAWHEVAPQPATVVKRLSEGREHVVVTVDTAQVRALFDAWLSELENAGAR